MLDKVLSFLLEIAQSDAADSVKNAAYDMAAEFLARELDDVPEDLVGNALVNIGERLLSDPDGEG